MALYPRRCPVCGVTKEIECLWSQLEARSRCECGAKMETNWSQLNGSIEHRSKGWYPYYDENLGAEPVKVESHQERMRLLKASGRVEGGLDREAAYRRKHGKESFGAGRRAR